jgi:histidinol-phosphate aminotransferase
MSSLVTPTIEQLRPYEAGKPVEEVERELGVTAAIKLASNENPLGPSPRAVAAVMALVGEVNRYPDAGAYRLRQVLAANHGVTQSEVIQGAGSNELLELLVRTFCTGADHVLFGEPSFVVYRSACLAHGVPFSAVPLRDDTHDLPAIAAAVMPNTRIIFIANPNNPTGTHVGRETLGRFLREIPPDVIIVLDEAYVEYADAPDFVSALELRSLRERLVVLRTFSKAYGLAALRVGYGIAPAYLCDYLNRVRAPFNVSSLGQAAAIAALSDKDYLTSGVALNKMERDRLYQGLLALGVRPTPSQANFVYVDLGRPAHPVHEALMLEGIIARPFAALPSHLRISVGTTEQNGRALAALGKVLS